ncbi:GIY-YIG nuclease family protein [Methylomonas sp. AM2-LC]|uniref:GIY-YIG nuclease family protein n=1 Tax=Methylomonas sp. AM2-LC TaxID=3153301 RepID=UPI0032645023
MTWSVYIILCSDNSLYTGISTDVERRFRQHATQKGAKYFRHCQPLSIVHIEQGHNRSSASCREAVIKKMPHHLKLKLISHALSIHS